MRRTISPIARLALVLVAVFGLLAVTTPAGASIDNLTIIPSPSPGPNFNRLESVSCVSESWCIAVGVTDDGTLVLLWDGTAWTQMTSPNPAGGSQVLLNEVSCVSESFCVAVGSYELQGTDMTLVLRWNGASWTQTTSPSPGSFPNLRSVSCVSAEWCIAVGEYYFQQNNDSLVLLWNGRVWTQVSSSVVATTSGAEVEINSVSCVSTSSCTAVGWYNLQPNNASAVHQTLVLSWDGTIWSVVESPNIGNEDNELYSVSCVTSSWCVAVGETSGPTLIVGMAGTSTTPVDPVAPAFTG